MSIQPFQIFGKSKNSSFSSFSSQLQLSRIRAFFPSSSPGQGSVTSELSKIANELKSNLFIKTVKSLFLNYLFSVNLSHLKTRTKKTISRGLIPRENNKKQANPSAPCQAELTSLQKTCKTTTRPASTSSMGLQG